MFTSFVVATRTENKMSRDSIFTIWHLVTVYSDVLDYNPRDERPAGLYRGYYTALSLHIGTGVAQVVYSFSLLGLTTMTS